MPPPNAVRPARPARPPAKEARDFNEDLALRIEEKINAARVLLEEAKALAADVVQDVEDIAKESIAEAVSEVGRFVNNLDFLTFRANERKELLRQKVAQRKAEAALAAQAAGSPVP